MDKIIRDVGRETTHYGLDGKDADEGKTTKRPAKRAVILSALTLSLTAIIILSQILIKFLSDLSENDRILSLLKIALTEDKCGLEGGLVKQKDE